jgi:hypothetical protein
MNNSIILLEMRKKKTMHVLHLLLSLISGGLWLIVWIICGLSNHFYNKGLDEKIDRIVLMEASGDK